MQKNNSFNVKSFNLKTFLSRLNFFFPDNCLFNKRQKNTKPSFLETSVKTLYFTRINIHKMNSSENLCLKPAEYYWTISICGKREEINFGINKAKCLKLLSRNGKI